MQLSKMQESRRHARLLQRFVVSPLTSHSSLSADLSSQSVTTARCRSVLCLSIAFIDANLRVKGPGRPIVHVALVGVTGVGKSTLVNVLMGKAAAEANNNVRPCTTRATRYEVVEGGTTYCIWDTRGLNEGSEATLPIRVLRLANIVPDSNRELKRLLRGKNPRVDLVLLCIEAKKIRVKVHWKIYNKIYVDFCKSEKKVAVVVTQMGEKDFRGSEWKRQCALTARGVVEEFPNAGLMEAVPRFEELDDSRVKDCRDRILGLISNAV